MQHEYFIAWHRKMTIGQIDDLSALLDKKETPSNL